MNPVTVRPAGLEDVEALEAMHARCSPTSLYRRFHAPLSVVTARMVRQLVRPVGGWSIVAEREGALVALACAAPVSDSEVEVGLLVEDRHQRRGIGARLLHQVAQESARRGYQAVQVLALPENDRVLSTVRRAGLVGRVTWHDSLLLVEVPLRRLTLADLPHPA